VKRAANLVLLLIATEIASWPLGGSHSSLAFSQDLTSGRNVDRILDGYVTSIGGADHLGKLTTLRMKGRVSQAASQLTGQVQIDEKVPGKWMEAESFRFQAPPPRDHSERRMGFNGKVGWSGLDDLDAATLAERNLVFDLNRPLRLRAIYRSLKLTGTQQIEADHPNLEYRGADDAKGAFAAAVARAASASPSMTDAYVVDGVRPDGAVDKLYFDTKAGLLRRCDLATAPGQYRLTWYMEDYRDVDNVKVPFRLVYRQNFSGSVVDTVFQFREVYDNIGIPDAEFEKSASKP
jgi:hypothetical protein